MCGISGLVLTPGEVVRPSVLEAMAISLAHRGPDAEGIFHRGHIGLVHRRLKILDLSDAANQPFWNEAQDTAIVYNGEIYNFRELRRELELDGYTFRTTGDTEVLLNAYHRWGAEAFRRLNGIFAFAVLDLRVGSPIIYLVRDRFGTKPLFYSYQNRRLAFASELKPLMQVDWISREIDPQTLYYFLKFSHVPHPLSIFKHIVQLPPGRYLRLQDDGVSEHTFWSASELIHRNGSGNGKSEAEWLDDLETTLDGAVRRQLISDVPVGCFLSGGIDSSLLTLASARNGGKVKTFSIGYQEAEFDETRYAQQVATSLGTEHHEYIVSAKDLTDLIPELPKYYDQPLADPTVLPTLLLCKNAREKVTVALAGDGGDELFFGYTAEQILLKLEPLLHFPTGIRRNMLSATRSILQPVLSRVGLRGQQISKLLDILQFSTRAECFQYFIGTFGPMRLDRIANLVKDKPSTVCTMYESIADELKDVSWPEQIAQVFVRTFLVDTVLAKSDRAGMAFGLELRVPFLDDEMAAFSETLPFEYKYRKGAKKYLLRRLTAKCLPNSIANRKKQGFSIPIRDWMRNDLKWLVDEYLNQERLRAEGLFDPVQVCRIVDEYMNHRANHYHLIWSLIMFQLWKEHYRV